MSNAFQFMLKPLLVFDIFKFLSWPFTHVEKRLDKKTKGNFKVYDVADTKTNNCNIFIVQYLKK